MHPAPRDFSADEEALMILKQQGRLSVPGAFYEMNGSR
jgi:hypothetical protein